MGADVHAQDEFDSHTVMACAAAAGDTDIMAMLLQHGADVQAMHSARNGATVCFLVRAGASIDGPIDTTNPTPLSWALRNKRVDIARALIDCGARLDRVQCPIPAWVPPFVAAREWCRYAALLLLGIWRLRRSAVLSRCNRDVLQLMAHAVWQTRMDPAWERCLEPLAKK